jgi:hypothetical protein
VSDLFGPTATPRWMDNQERGILNNEEGRQNAASFNSAFQAAYARHDEQRMELQKQAKQMEALKPVATAFQGADTPEKSLEVLSAHPEWMANPQTSGFVQNWMQTQATIAGTKIKAENAKSTLESQKRSIDWDNAKGAASQDVISAIDALPNQGWTLGQNGQRISPSPNALNLLNQWRTANKMLPFGAKQTEIAKPDALQVEQERQKGRVDLEKQRETGRTDLEKTKQVGRSEMEKQKAADKLAFEQERQKDRKEIESVKAKYNMDITKMKLDASGGKGGKAVSEDEFVNRHITAVFNAMYKNNSDPKLSLADADRALRARYRVDHKQAPGTAAPAPTPAPETAPAAKPDNAKDPLGLF